MIKKDQEYINFFKLFYILLIILNVYIFEKQLIMLYYLFINLVDRLVFQGDFLK